MTATDRTLARRTGEAALLLGAAGQWALARLLSRAAVKADDGLDVDPAPMSSLDDRRGSDAYDASSR